MKSFRIRPFAISGRYPRGDFQVGSALIFRSGKFMFSCVENVMVSEFGKIVSEQPAHELENWTSHELRFFASIYLGGVPYRRVQLYPLPVMQDFELGSIDDLISDGSLLRGLIAKTAEDSYFMRSNFDLIPTHIEDYKILEWDELEFSQCRSVWDCLKPDNLVALRGLYSLLKSEMLFQHHQFGNAALAEAHISLDAAHSMVRKILMENGNVNPTSVDAGKYVSELFNEDWLGNRFFEDFYEDRIRNAHADNRFGAEAIPSFCVDDLWFLQRGLRELYFTLLTTKYYLRPNQPTPMAS